MTDINQNQAGVLNYYRNVRSASLTAESQPSPPSLPSLPAPPPALSETPDEPDRTPTVTQPQHSQGNNTQGARSVTSLPDEFRPLPPDHIVLGVLTIVLCCAWPCGIVSLSHAVQVNPEHASGNYGAAEFNSRKAWRWGIAGIAFGCLLILITILYLLVLMSFRVSKQS